MDFIREVHVLYVSKPEQYVCVRCSAAVVVLCISVNSAFALSILKFESGHPVHDASLLGSCREDSFASVRQQAFHGLRQDVCKMQRLGYR